MRWENFPYGPKRRAPSIRRMSESLAETIPGQLVRRLSGTLADIPGHLVRRWSESLDVPGHLEGEIGRIPVSGRYHRAPRTIKDDYDVTAKVLGSGLSGPVHLATHRSHPEQHFAVKVLPLSSLALSALEQLTEEVVNFLRMDHPHITRLYHVYQSKESLALVMECMEGGELFERIKEVKRFAEKDAAHALWQMLLAVNYLHSHKLVHRDLKLENFLYDKKGSSTLKLIDFGFSKMWDSSEKMHVSIGTIGYVAPEVLKQSYTNQCDLWSLGVIGFVLLSGYMPFPGTGGAQIRSIMAGKFEMRPERWRDVSQEAGHFVRQLLEVDPQQRMTAQAALVHPWIARYRAKDDIDIGVVAALQQFGHTTKFRRCCMEMMAWSLSREQTAEVCGYFIALDHSRRGTITLEEFRDAMDSLGITDEEEVRLVFRVLDTKEDHEIHYSDFLAAMVSTKIELDEELMDAAFRNLDSDGSGYITSADLHAVLGDTFEGEDVVALLKEAGKDENDGISYPEFKAFLRSTESRRSSLKDRCSSVAPEPASSRTPDVMLPRPVQSF